MVGCGLSQTGTAEANTTRRLEVHYTALDRWISLVTAGLFWIPACAGTTKM